MAASRVPKLLSEGRHAPDLTFTRLEGGEVTLRDLLADGPVLLAFFKISCPVCQLTYPFLERLHNSGKLPIYGVSQNDEDDTREFNRRFGVTFPTLLDREEDDYPASNAVGLSSVPTVFLMERDGTVSRVIEGWQKKPFEALGATFRPGEFVPEMKAG
jgi:peroxiredoxin